MDSSALVSVIIPVYNVETYLDACIKSVLAQTYCNLEIILVDDGSTDACGAMCDSWACADPRVRVIHKPNGGLSDARNAGLDICTGEYIMFVDSDDSIDTTMIEKLHNALKGAKADFVSSGIYYQHDEKEKDWALERGFVCTGIEALKLLYSESGIPVSSCGKLYLSTLWNDVRFPVDRLYEDVLTSYKILDQCEKAVQISESLYRYRVRSGSISHSSFSLKLLDLQEAWKENYLFCKEEYPELENIARVNWLTYLPAILDRFPKEMTDEEKRVKAELKKEILRNLPFFISQNQPKKLYYQVRALFY